jgi:hypothetical protein
MWVFRGSPLNLRGCPLSYIYSQNVVVILANGMIDIAGDAPQLFMFTSIRDLDGDMWDNVESGISHLSPLILILARKYPLNILYELG